MHLLEIEKLVKRFGALTVLDGIDLHLPAKSIHGVIGPNGAGKTTLFDVITGMSPADGGSIRLDGTEITRKSIESVAEMGVGRTFQVARVFNEMTLLDPDAASYAWSFGELQPGTYEVRFNPLGQMFSFEALPGGMPSARLEIPPPAQLDVSVVDEQTGQPVEDAQLGWVPSREKFSSGGVLNTVMPREPGRFRLQAPAGEVEIRCSSNSHRFRREIVSLAPGIQAFEVKTARAEGIDLRVLAGETIMPLDDVEITITEVEGDGEGWVHDTTAIRARCVVSHAGIYKIEMTRLPGAYRLPAPSVVQIPDNEFVPVTIAIER